MPSLWHVYLVPPGYLQPDLRASQALPEDYEGESNAGPIRFADGGARDWPNQGDNLERVIFIPGGIDPKQGGKFRGPFAQIQKWDSKEKKWKIWNRWGQNLLFERDPVDMGWSAGWDFGEWLGENAKALQDAVFAVFEMICTVAAPFTGGATIAAGAAVEGLNRAGNAILAKDAGAAAEAFASVAIAMAGVAPGAQARLPDSEKIKVPGVLTSLSEMPAFKVIARVVSDGEKFGEDTLKNALAAIDLSTKFVLVGGVPTRVGEALDLGLTDQAISDVRNLVEGHLKIWFDKGYEMGFQAVANPAQVPWYAQAIFSGAGALGAAQGRGVGTKAQRFVDDYPDQRPQDPITSIAKHASRVNPLLGETNASKVLRLAQGYVAVPADRSSDYLSVAIQIENLLKSLNAEQIGLPVLTRKTSLAEMPTPQEQERIDDEYQRWSRRLDKALRPKPHQIDWFYTLEIFVYGLFK